MDWLHGQGGEEGWRGSVTVCFVCCWQTVNWFQPTPQVDAGESSGTSLTQHLNKSRERDRGAGRLRRRQDKKKKQIRDGQWERSRAVFLTLWSVCLYFLWWLCDIWPNFFNIVSAQRNFLSVVFVCVSGRPTTHLNQSQMYNTTWGSNWWHTHKKKKSIYIPVHTQTTFCYNLEQNTGTWSLLGLSVFFALDVIQRKNPDRCLTSVIYCSLSVTVCTCPFWCPITPSQPRTVLFISCLRIFFIQVF